MRRLLFLVSFSALLLVSCDDENDASKTCGDGTQLPVISDSIFSGTPDDNMTHEAGECLSSEKCVYLYDSDTGKLLTYHACSSEKQGKLNCDNNVVDALTDNRNCGKCGNVCVEGAKCESGICKCDIASHWSGTAGSCTCESGYTLVSGKCEVTQTCNANETYDASTNTCKCDIASHWSGTAGSCTCESGYLQAGNICKLSINIGDIITFGHYEQDNDTTNGKEPITWRVLDKKNDAGQYLIISEKALDVQSYNTTPISIMWEKSTLRSWLNGYAASYNTVVTSYSSDNFIDAAFTAEEKAKIVSSSVPAHKNPSYSTDPGNATTDKIFLLSVTEAQAYFTSDTDRKADATRYAVKKGAYVLGSSSGKYSNDGVCTDDHCYSHWWLRSPGIDVSDAALVYGVGSISSSGRYVNYDHIAVRPALWVNL